MDTLLLQVLRKPRNCAGKGPFSVFGIPLILKPTPVSFNLEDKVNLQVPIWFRIPNLPLTLWTKSTIEKIASSVGIPVVVDHSTFRRQTLDGPRVQVILDIQKDPREKNELVLLDGSSLHQKIVYEQLPKFCHTCHAFGHITLGLQDRRNGKGSAWRAKKENRRERKIRDRSRGRDTAVCGSANGLPTESNCTPFPPLDANMV